MRKPEAAVGLAIGPPLLNGYRAPGQKVPLLPGGSQSEEGGGRVGRGEAGFDMERGLGKLVQKHLTLDPHN